MSSSFRENKGAPFAIPVTTFLYRDIAPPAVSHDRESRRIEAEAPRGPSPQQIDEIVNRARREAIAETEARLEQAHQVRLEAQARGVREALDVFENEKKTYFSRVEGEVVQLALSIAAKILHRQAQVDPMLVAALVRVAVDKLHDGSSVNVRVSPVAAGRWRETLANPLNGSTIEIVEDPHLGVDDCVLETEMGSANFSLDAQLKEVEQSFFDLLAQRPTNR